MRHHRGIFSQARAIISYLEVYELSCIGSEVARAIRISEKGVSKCVERGKKVIGSSNRMCEYLPKFIR